MKPEERTYGKKYNRKMVRSVIRAHYGTNKLVGATFHKLRGTIPMKDRVRKEVK